MDEIVIGGSRRARVGYDLRDVSLLPSRRTRDTSLVDIGWSLDAYSFAAPILGAPLDGVTDVRSAAALATLGGVGVLSLEGLWTRYDDARGVLEDIATWQPSEEATQRLQRLYRQPIRADLVGKRVEELKASGFAAGSLRPGEVHRYHGAALEAGLDLLVVHGITVTAQHVAADGHEPLDLRDFTARYDIPVVIGGVSSAKSALHLMRTGAVGVLVGSEASSLNTSGAVLGIDVPLATAIADVAAARSRYLEESGRYVHVIVGGGVGTGGDLARAIACGADAVMIGRPFAAADEAPARGAYWGLAAAHQELPRSRFEIVEHRGSLRSILEGPADGADGSMNLLGGLRRAMGVTGYDTLRRLREAELMVRR